MQKRLSAIIGQKLIVERLETLGSHATRQGLPVPHALLAGPDGMGKRTLIEAFCGDFGAAGAQFVRSRDLRVRGDVTALLTNLQHGQFLVIEEADSLPRELGELVADSANTFRLQIHIGQGLRARIHVLDLKPFSLMCTVRNLDSMDHEFRAIFPFAAALGPYPRPELAQIAEEVARSSGPGLGPGVAELLADAAGGLPGRLRVLLQNLGDARTDAQRASAILGAFGGAGLPPAGASRAMDLAALPPSQFEATITSLLQRMGFRAEMTKAGGDGGIDVIASMDTPMLRGKFLIQCKRYSRETTIGVPVVREFYGAVAADPRTTKGVLVATCGFTAQAKDFAHSVGLELIDGEELATLCAKYFESGAVTGA